VQRRGATARGAEPQVWGSAPCIVKRNEARIDCLGPGRASLLGGGTAANTRGGSGSVSNGPSDTGSPAEDLRPMPGRPDRLASDATNVAWPLGPRRNPAPDAASRAASVGTCGGSGIGRKGSTHPRVAGPVKPPVLASDASATGSDDPSPTRCLSGPTDAWSQGSR
jgi:hypothetical protein